MGKRRQRTLQRQTTPGRSQRGGDQHYQAGSDCHQSGAQAVQSYPPASGTKPTSTKPPDLIRNNGHIKSGWTASKSYPNSLTGEGCRPKHQKHVNTAIAITHSRLTDLLDLFQTGLFATARLILRLTASDSPREVPNRCSVCFSMENKGGFP